MSFSLPFKYITAELAEIIKSKPASALKEFAVVDVRDSDFVGGNIVSAINCPSDTFHASVDGLVKKLESVPKVIFRIAIAQTARSLKPEDLKPLDITDIPTTPQIYAETRAHQVPSSTTQEIYVLRDGFSGFQSRYRHDPELIEKFNKYYHD